MNQEIDKLEPAPQKPTLEMVLADRKDKILEMGGFSEKEVARFIATALTSVATNPKLNECSLDSLVLALYDAARCGLAPNSITQEGHLIPFKNKRGGYDCVFVVGYRGVLNMLHATGFFSNIEVKEVRENDEFFIKEGLHPDLHHIKAEKNRGHYRGCYAVAHLKDGGAKFEYVSKEEGEEHRDRFTKSKIKGKVVGPWVDDFPAMCMKTALKKLAKYCPTAPGTQHLFAAITFDEKQERPPTQVEHPGIKTPQELTDADLKPPVMVDPDTGEVIPDEIVKDKDAGKNKELFDEEI